MNKVLLAIATCAGLSAQAPAQDQASTPSVPVKLWRLDCGALDENREKAFAHQRMPTPTPCFLVAHGSDYLLWDTGLTARAIGANHPVAKLDRSIADQLKQIGVTSDQIRYVAISHYHGDHTGQAASFPKATLLIGAADYAAVQSKTPPGGASATHFEPWIKGQGKVEPLAEDHDIFGDDTVRMLMAPGHTPGHMALLVKLASGPVILSGDLWFSHDDALRGTMPDFNTSRAETAASRERIGRMAEALDAVVILHHELADVAKLPPFPQAAE